MTYLLLNGLNSQKTNKKALFTALKHKDGLMMFRNLQDYQLQVKLFCEHLSQDYLAGFIIGPKGSKKNRDIKIDLSTEYRPNVQPPLDDENLYFVPQVCEQYGKEDCVKAITTLFVDLDETSEVPNFDETQVPNLVIRRSDGRAYQWFYFLGDPISEKEFRKYQHTLSGIYKSDDSIKNPNRLARMAGIRRGDKSKDKKCSIEAGLHYEVVSSHSQKMSKGDLTAFMAEGSQSKILDRSSIKGDDKATTQPEHDDPLLKPSQFWGRGEVEEEGRIYPVEEAAFYGFFSKENHSFENYKNMTAGEGLRNALFKFACYLQDRGVLLTKFRDYLLNQNIDPCKISGCEDEVFEEMEFAAKKYAKNQKKLIQKEEQKEIQKQAANPNAITFDELFKMYPLLSEVYYTEMRKYYFVESEDTFYRQDPGNRLTKISKTLFDKTFQRNVVMKNKKGKFVKGNATNLFLAYETRHFFNITSMTGYQPHGARMYFDGSYILNTWFSPLHKKEKTGSLTIFLNHIKWLFKDQKSITGEDLGEFFLDYLAYVYCNPAPANFAWLIYARNMGLGRSFFTDLLRQLMGNENVSAPTPRIAYDQYTSWHSTKQFAVVEELTADKGFYDQLKPIISNELVAHREMHKNPSTVTNYCNMMLLSNQMDCLKIAEKDRRILVVHMHQDVQSPEYYDALYGWKKDKDNIAELADFLVDRNGKIDQRKMLGHALVTNAKLLMQRVNKNNSLQDLEERINGLSFGQNKEFVDQKSIIDSIYPNMPDAVIKYRNSVASNMQKLGYVTLFTGKQLRIGSKQERLTVFIEAKYAEKYTGETKFEDVIEEYSIYKKIPFEKKEQTKLQPIILAPVVATVQQEVQPTDVTVAKPVVKAPSTSAKSGSTKKPSSPKKEKINALVAEARRRAEQKTTDKKVPTVEDLIEIRTKRMTQKVDVSILYH